MRGRWRGDGLVRGKVGLCMCGHGKCGYGIGVGKCFLQDYIAAAEDNNTNRYK